ncbi:MAG: radical SAM protein [Bacteroidales bacterium]|nr:radical SAM protein [Bacteroidales bacterium]MCF8458745.1 radical SAM protein [Bacteroidales bacterium]
MDAYYSYLNGLVNKNKTMFPGYPGLKWINPYSASEFQEIRDRYMATIGNSVSFNGTKPYHKQLSKGCQLCGEGLWSCLFITGKCNAKCFYCPTQQTIDEVPSSQGLTFPTAASYAEYVSHFKFKGVSFSGGEPLLFPDRVLDYLGQVRKNCSPDIYTWMYTNGILATEELFRKLAALDLNEVRFDIGATAYSLDKIKLAKGIIQNITIEIPAVPEEKELLKALLPDMVKAGVTNLNLHQLRLTEFNIPNLSKRNYTYIPAEKPIVLESELAALEIIEYAKKHQIDIGINYCSFFFKNRFQAAGFRRQIANSLAPSENVISPKGFIRKYEANEIRYYAMRIADEGKILGDPQVLELSNKKYGYCTDLIHLLPISNETEHQHISDFLATPSEIIPDGNDMFGVWMHETIESGLRAY